MKERGADRETDEESGGGQKACLLLGAIFAGLSLFLFWSQMDRLSQEEGWGQMAF